MRLHAIPRGNRRPHLVGTGDPAPLYCNAAVVTLFFSPLGRHDQAGWSVKNRASAESGDRRMCRARNSSTAAGVFFVWHPGW